MSLISELRSKDKKQLFSTNDAFTPYSTGLLPLDYANGFQAPLARDRVAPIAGVMGGTFITIIGLSGSGKTTLADQIAYNIIRPFDDGVMIHVDIEKTALKARIAQVTGSDPEDPRIILDKDRTSIEDVLDMIAEICNEKESGGEKYKYTIPEEYWVVPDKPTKVYVPTVLILDSLATFNSRERKEDTLEGQMSGGREASQISQFYSKCLNSMNRYNITIIAVNHIKSTVDINPYQSHVPQMMLLKQGESLPRGVAPIYLAQNIFRCNATKGNIYTIEENGFQGFMCKIQVAKTKTAFIGSEVNVCFNSEIGFDPIYTLYEFATQAGLIEGRNPYLYIKGLDTMKFNRKQFRVKFISEPEFRDGVMSIMQPYLFSLLGSKDPTGEKTTYESVDGLLSKELPEESKNEEAMEDEGGKLSKKSKK